MDLDADRPVQKFPDTYSIKAVGKDDAGDFAEFAQNVVRNIVDDPASVSHYSRASRSGKYLSVTISFVARDQAQLDQVFFEMSKQKRVVWVL